MLTKGFIDYCSLTNTAPVSIVFLTTAYVQFWKNQSQGNAHHLTFLFYHSFQIVKFFFMLKNEITILLQCHTQSFFRLTSTCTRIGTLIKLLESAMSDQQKLWLYLAGFRCQTTKQSSKIIR